MAYPGVQVGDVRVAHGDVVQLLLHLSVGMERRPALSASMASRLQCHGANWRLSASHLAWASGGVLPRDVFGAGRPLSSAAGVVAVGMDSLLDATPS